MVQVFMIAHGTVQRSRYLPIEKGELFGADDLLVIASGNFKDHLDKLEYQVPKHLQETGLDVNATKSFFAREQLEYLGTGSPRRAWNH